MSIWVNVQSMKDNLSKLLSAVKDGSEVVITSDNIPIAKLVPVPPLGERKAPGSMKELVSLPPDFFAPLSDEELTEWGI